MILKWTFPRAILIIHPDPQANCLVLPPLEKGLSRYKISNLAMFSFYLQDESIVAVNTVNGADDEICSKKDKGRGYH